MTFESMSAGKLNFLNGFYSHWTRSKTRARARALKFSGNVTSPEGLSVYILPCFLHADKNLVSNAADERSAATKLFFVREYF